MEDLAIRKELLKIESVVYGEQYESHIMSQYQMFVEMADRISQRRQQAHTFFLSVNSFLIAAVGFIVGKEEYGIYVALPLFVFGGILTYPWFRLVKSYRQLNSAKFKVIHEIEQLLPLAPYDAEWEALGRGEDTKLYTPFSEIESWIPFLFLFIHLFGIAGSIYLSI